HWLESTNELLAKASAGLITQATHLNLPFSADLLRDEDYAEPLPMGRLPQDRPMRKIKSAAEIITYVATAYLNLAAESELLHIVNRVKPSQYSSCFPNPLSEDSIRYLKFRFHSLQSLYDTHVSETEIESLDTSLPVLRGHISVVYHLLEIATHLAHYYERHLNVQTGDSLLRRKPVVSTRMLLAMLMNYAIAYAGQYLDHGQRLCQVMLKRYAEVGIVVVPVPSYRGFHVRPATLVAKIVQHYGSDITLELDGQSYDAGSPMAIFRANETINARKRRWLATEIARISPPKEDLNESEVRAAVLDVVLKLAQEGKLVLYQQPLRLAEEFSNEGILLEKVTAEIARLQATGQIDIRADLTICFAGDQRVLDDLELLARYGYGEDSFGNNTTLPKELTYLRR
ncbi:MAG: HPr family phosphocarrier protein, partial [Candidatus Contendobacter sp.]|nr:HPr family phosphocarrier protein [Candidatus Contendobacter sp.]